MLKLFDLLFEILLLSIVFSQILHPLSERLVDTKDWLLESALLITDLKVLIPDSSELRHSLAPCDHS